MTPREYQFLWGIILLGFALWAGIIYGSVKLIGWVISWF